MPRTLTAIKVVLASPSDVAPQREIARDIVNELNIELRHRNLFIEIAGWEDAIPGVSNTAQDVIDEQILRDADIVICLFGARLGTPVKGEVSGTVHELRRLIENRDNMFGSLRAQIYFVDYDIPPSKIIPDEFARLNEFRSTIGQSGAFYKLLSSDADLRLSIRIGLQKCAEIALTHSKTSNPITTAGNSSPPIETPKEGAIIEENAASSPEDELGLFEYIQAADQKITLSAEYIGKYSNELNRLTNTTENLVRGAGSASAMSLSERKLMLDSFATELITGATRLQSFCENAMQHLRSGVDLQKQTIAISASDFDRIIHQENMDAIISATTDTLIALSQLASTIPSTRESFMNWPRLTAKIGRAKARMLSAMDETLRLFGEGERMLLELISDANKSLH